MTDPATGTPPDDTPGQAAARAWLHSYGINTSSYTEGGGDHSAMRTLPEAFEAFAGRYLIATLDPNDEATVIAVARAIAPKAWAAYGVIGHDSLANGARRTASIRHARDALTALAKIGGRE